MTECLWAGLDLGEEVTTVCIVNDAGEAVHEKSCGSTAGEVEEALNGHVSAIRLIAAEAGTGTHLVRQLVAKGYPVRIFEARKAKQFLSIRRNKTDAGDARGIADLARLGQHTVSQVHLQSIETQQLRAEIVLRQKLVRLRVAVENGIRSRFATYGRRLKASYSAKGLREKVEREAAVLLAQEGVDLHRHVEPLLLIAETLRSYLGRLDRELEKRAKEHLVCKRLMEVPGVGPLCALSFVSAIEDPDRFKRASDVGAYLGLVPRRHQSGDVSRTLGITKTGSKLVRTHLVTAAQVMRMRKVDCALAEWGDKLKERLGSQRAKVAVARKLAIVLLTMWKTGSHYEPHPRRHGLVA